MAAANNVFWKQVSIVLGGTVAAQAIPVLGSLILARLFAPAEFGIYSAWLGFVLFFSVVITGRLEMALAMEPDGEPRRLAAIATLITAVLGGLLLSVIALLLWLVVPSSINHIPTKFALLLAITAISQAFVQTWQAWAAAEGEYFKLSLMRICVALTVTLGQIGIGMVIPSAATLAVAYFLGLLLGALISSILMPVGRCRSELVQVVLSFWRRYRRFPQLSLPADTINTGATQLPLIIVASRFGPEMAGFLALTMRTLGAPIGLMGKAVLDVFRRHAAIQWREQGNCTAAYQRTLLVLSCGTVLASAIFFFVGEEIFRIAFGENWKYSGLIAVWLLPLFALRFVASPLSYMFYLSEKQNIDLIWQMALLLMTIMTLLLPKDFKSALQLYSAGYSALYIVYLALSYKLSKGEKA